MTAPRSRDIVIVSSIDWARNWQIHQQLATSLVAQGHRLLFIENTGVRSPRKGDFQRISARLKNWLTSTRGFREVSEDLMVFSPLFIPLPYAWWAVAMNRYLLTRAIRRWCRASGFRNPTLITFLPTPLVQGLIEGLDPCLTIYYCANDMAGGSEGAARLRPVEEAFFAKVDAVFCNSQALLDRARTLGGRAYLFPVGVDFDKFDQARQCGDLAPALKAMTGPKVGYVGSISHVFDQDALAHMARRLPHVQFVLVGPLSADVTRLQAYPNIHLVGPRPHDEIPGFIQGFDVALIPYVRNDFTEAVYPCKLNEYLAMGVPVVSRDLSEIRAYRDRHGDVVTLASTPDDYVSAIAAALSDASAAPLSMAADREARVAAARVNSWPQRFTEMLQVINELMWGKQRDRQPWQARLTALYRQGRRRTLAALIAPLGLYGLVFHTPLVWWLGQPLVLDQAPHSAQAIVVFSGEGDPTPNHGGYKRRVQDALRLHRAGWAPRIVISSGWGRGSGSESHAVKAMLVDQGVPATQVEVLDHVPSSTLANVQMTGAELRRRGINKVLFVTGPYHERRAAAVWARQVPDAQVTTVWASGVSAEPPWGKVPPRLISTVAYEYAAWAHYWMQGWL